MGPKSTSQVDRRVVRTRRLLRDALIGLLHVRGWDEISVQDICARADVGRSTFYVHFADKEELLLAGFDDLRRMIRGQLAAQSGPGAGPLRFARAMIEHAHENERLFRALVGRRSGQVVLRRFRELVVELVQEELPSSPSLPAREAAVHFLSGAFLELLTWSLEPPRALGPAALEQLFREMAGPAMAVAQSRR